MTHVRTLPQKGFHVADFYRHLPPDVPNEEQKSLAEYIADCLGALGEYLFVFKDSYVLRKQARGRTTTFANARVYRFTCSQRPPRQYTSTLPYGRTRNRRHKVQCQPCTGILTITFPSNPCSFDFALQNDHPCHPGRPYFGVPKYIRTWIFDNPRSTPQVQREDLLKAIERGEISGATEKFLKPSLIHYWWRKAYQEKKQPSNDPWENMRLFLEDHPSVLPLIGAELTFILEAQSYAAV